MKHSLRNSAFLYLATLMLLPACMVRAQVQRGDCPFYEKFRTLTLEEREELAYAEILAGNVPEYMKGFVRITTRQKDLNGKTHHVTLFVKPDYLTVLSGNVPFIVPLTPMIAGGITGLFAAYAKNRGYYLSSCRGNSRTFQLYSARIPKPGSRPVL